MQQALRVKREILEKIKIFSDYCKIYDLAII